MNINKGAILISGGSRGLGLNFVENCLKRGYPVATFARTETDDIRQLKKEYAELLLFSELDATNLDALKDFVGQTGEKFQHIYGLINNAAIGQDHLLSHLATEKIEQIVKVNLLAPILLTKLVIKKMLIENKAGHIINISSICGSRGYPGLSVYSATKGALDAFTRSMAREVGERNILINSIAPGFFLSEMSSLLSDQQMQTITRRTPTNKLVEPEEILPILNLLLFENSNMTGQTVYIDGGITI